jgi:hypothetical protein
MSPRSRNGTPARGGGFAASLLFLLLTTCSEGNPLNVVGAPFAPFEPPTLYQAWWGEIEACSRRSGDFQRIDWLKVEAGADGTFPCGPRECAGAWERPHAIYIAGSYVGAEQLVKHEMIHDLVQSGSHLDPAFFDCRVLFLD